MIYAFHHLTRKTSIKRLTHFLLTKKAGKKTWDRETHCCKWITGQKIRKIGTGGCWRWEGESERVSPYKLNRRFSGFLLYPTHFRLVCRHFWSTYVVRGSHFITPDVAVPYIFTHLRGYTLQIHNLIFNWQQSQLVNKNSLTPIEGRYDLINISIQIPEGG